MTIPQALALALQHLKAGRFAEAEAVYRQILAVDPRQADALHLLGLVAQQTGRIEMAVALFRESVALAPSSAGFHCNLGASLLDNGFFDEAIATCRRAIILQPDLAAAHSNLGKALQATGRNAEAIAPYRQAIALGANLPEIHLNLGSALREQGQLEPAIAAFRQAIALQPTLAEAWCNLGNALRDQDQMAEAAAASQQAIRLQPAMPEAHNNLGNVLRDVGRTGEAIVAYRQAIALRPGYAEAHHNIANALCDRGEVHEAVAACRQAIALRPGLAEAHSTLLLTLHYQPSADPRLIAEEHRRWNQQHAEPLRGHLTPHRHDSAPDRRLRIGYVSPDFREHPVGRFLLPLLLAHDHRAVDVHCFSQVAIPDALTGQLRDCSDHWHSLVGLNDEQAAERVRGAGINILVDLAGHTGHHRLLVFARQPAPVQVSWLGYPDTTGLSAVDYRLTDSHADPPGLTEDLHSEQLVRLPESAWCFPPPVPSPPLEPLPSLATGHVTFGCFSAQPKMNAEILALWARLLLAVPGSLLLLKNVGFNEAFVRERVLAIFSRAGVETNRVETIGRIPSMTGHLAAYSRVDIALDTFPYHGTTTTCEALWMGVPVVTLAGSTHVSRVGVSLLTNAGLPDLIARTSDDYLAIATQLAGNIPRLTELRATLRTRLTASPLMDAPRFARNIEAAYREMWRRWCVRADRNARAS